MLKFRPYRLKCNALDYQGWEDNPQKSIIVSFSGFQQVPKALQINKLRTMILFRLFYRKVSLKYHRSIIANWHIRIFPTAWGMKPHIRGIDSPRRGGNPEPMFCSSKKIVYDISTTWFRFSPSFPLFRKRRRLTLSPTVKDWRILSSATAERRAKPSSARVPSGVSAIGDVMR